MNKTLVALLINLFVLPGAGQVYLGRKGKGIAIIALTNIILLAGIFLVMKIMSPVLAAHITGTPITADQILRQVQPYAFWAKLLLASMFAVWGYAVVDLAGAFRKQGH